MCPAAGGSSNETTAWVDVYTPEIVTRINAAAPGADLDGTDIVNLMSLCPFDTVADEAPSPWCDVFTPEEFTSYEYYGDLGDYYGNGWVFILPSSPCTEHCLPKIWTAARARSRRGVCQRAARPVDRPARPRRDTNQPHARRLSHHLPPEPHLLRRLYARRRDDLDLQRHRAL